MKRKKHFLAIAAIASIMALSTSAQNTPKSDAPFILKKVLPQAKKADTKFKEIKTFPLLNQMMIAQPKPSLLREPTDGNKLYAPKFGNRPLSVLPNLEMWANILSNNFVGVCWFNPTQKYFRSIL